MSQNLDIIQAYNDPNTQIRLLLGSDVVTGCVTNDTTIDASVSWNDPMSGIIEKAKNALSDQLGGMTKVAYDAARAVSPIQAQPIATTIKAWVASQGPTLSLPLLFLATKPGDDVRDPINKIMKYVLPTNSMGLMIPPGGYKNVALTGGGSDTGTAPDGVITIQIGRWFSAKQIMIISGSSSPTFSKEVISSGLPLWASITPTFTPYRAITYDDWLSFFP